MNKWFLLLIVIALAATGWYYRDTVSGYVRHLLPNKNTASESETAAQATPHPATESVAKARKLYPALAVANSPFNKRFVQLYNDARQNNPDLLAQADWPMQLAMQTNRELTSAVPTATGLPPTELSGSPLNGRPTTSSPGYTVPPSVQLPGLKGSALDQRPPPHGH